MASNAERDGDGYILNGHKTYVGNSHVGDLHGVIVRTGGGSKGLSAFLVEADRPGLSRAALKPAMGLHGFGFGELVFDNCRVPAETCSARRATAWLWPILPASSTGGPT
ncbi:acyl-CoA dehydrogenase family protein [Mesorhizobium sp.]|uniref:acyl-CoA dehydrogenase family protein n=1 Tax=Mesorhizobium sp. TaxID=1871066 RepID=UPI00338DA2FA